MTKYPSLQERLIANSVLSTESYFDGSPCWVWIGRASANYGRVNVRVNGKHTTQLAHRASWTAFKGPIPSGMEIDHLCATSLCINPEHMEPVKGSINLQRRDERKQARHAN